MVSGIILFFAIFAINFQSFSEENEDSSSRGYKISPIYEHVEFCTDILGENPQQISLTITPFSKTTYYQTGEAATEAKYMISSGEIFIKEYEISNQGEFSHLCNEVILRSEIESDFYSPLLRKDGIARQLSLFTDFGVYNIQ